jgi:hypothetical protein
MAPDQKPGTLDSRELDRLERLRDRTDEIELIISGLTTVALFTLPGWLFEFFSSVYTHHSQMTSQALDILLVILPGLFYALGTCFAVHLMIRAYWAGLVGLRSVFPDGIDWDRVPGMGRLTRQFQREYLPDLDQAITRADHAASALFSAISMIALGMLWVSACMVLVLVIGALVGAATGHFELALTVSMVALLGVILGAQTLLWLLDSVLGSRFPSLAERPAFRAVVHGLIRANTWIWPQRLILPVQLTLQTNTRPFLFAMLLGVGMMGIVVVGQLRYSAWSEFSLSREFRYLDDDALAEGIDSAHYEHLRGRRDRLRPVPTIDEFEQQGAFLRVFLPYHPLRDNPVLDADCHGPAEPVDCLRGLWSVRVNDRSVAAGDLWATERRDLNQRGLTGVLSLQGLAPGMHVLEVDWNTGDDTARRYRIPFLFSPAQEMAVGADSGENARAPVDP